MSRSFYVDSLIVKEPTLVSKRCRTTSPTEDHNHATMSPTRASPPAHMPTLHPVPCYPRHHRGMVSYCCPLCVVPPPAQLFSDRTMHQLVTTSGLTNLPSLPISYATSTAEMQLRTLGSFARSNLKHQTRCTDTVTLPNRHEHVQTSPKTLGSSPGNTSPLSDQRMVRYGAIGKWSSNIVNSC
ncbi:hypothetical protein DPMN_113298 [Dreissena polymorpha]|uniref:Uncharacterized protein n=1 Tax=Dreissena polymorpha TaxID=45954 RepID=A0A9D4KHY6_DREPO|nr:hypothetical protein DPMN_113298 [Dreissena polymorpha]